MFSLLERRVRIAWRCARRSAAKDAAHSHSRRAAADDDDIGLPSGGRVDSFAEACGKLSIRTGLSARRLYARSSLVTRSVYAVRRVARASCAPLAFFTSSISGGTMSNRFPTTAYIGNLEDRRLGVLVDRDDGARALHADDVLDGAADAQRQVELGRDGLAGGADLAVHGQPAGIADRTRRRNLSAQRFGQAAWPFRCSSAP